MTTPCPYCGSTRNPIGAINCVACKKNLPKSSSASLASAMLVASGGRKYNLSFTTATMIGSRGCAILLSGMGVEPQHAKLTPSGGGFTIEPIMGTVLLNGKTILSPTNLVPGASISIGSQTLSYSGSSSVLVPFGSNTSVSPTLIPVLASKMPVAVKRIPVLPPATSLKNTFQKIFNPDPILEGQVVVVDGPHQEQPDIDWMGLLVRVWFGLLLSPIVILLLFWIPALIIPFLLYGRGQRNPQVPARYLRVEDKSGKQYSVKMKGDSVGGMLNQGDAASFWGRRKNGTLIMSKAWNQTANSQVLLRTTVRKRINAIVLFVIVVVTVACLISLGLNY